MKIFDWEGFWRDHPRINKNNTKWANLRYSDYDYKKAVDNIDKYVKFKKGQRVLDVGCGTGEASDFVSRKTQVPVMGTDWSHEMIEIAQVTHPEHTFVHAPAHVLPFTDEKFDVVYMSGVIQHVPYPLFEASINEMFRVVKPGGIVFIGDVLEKADPAAEVFVYPKDVWNQFGKPEFGKSIFEGRLHVIYKK